MGEPPEASAMTNEIEKPESPSQPPRVPAAADTPGTAKRRSRPLAMAYADDGKQTATIMEGSDGSPINMSEVIGKQFFSTDPKDRFEAMLWALHCVHQRALLINVPDNEGSSTD